MNELTNKILDFWFNEIEQNNWFVSSNKIDDAVKSNFEKELELISDGKIQFMLFNNRSCLAYILLTDQFSRNIYRGHPTSFSYDIFARNASQLCLDQGFIENYNADERLFALLPLVHSEKIEDHEVVNKLREKWLSAHPMHDQIKKSFDDHAYAIKNFGRYPHRNIILKRESTQTEIEFLEKPDSSW